MTSLLLEPLAPRRPEGRAFSGHRKVRLGDVDPQGRLRLDALTRYTQDVSDDDTTDAGLDAEPGWVVRSTVVDEIVPARLGERLDFDTFCSGFGGRWAERRLTVTGDGSGSDPNGTGARYEVATLWVCVDATSGRPHRLTDQFQSLYGEAAGDRRISARQVNAVLPPETGPDHYRSWQVRRADLDVYGHVNNAAYWAAVEQWVAPWSGPRRARLEYGGGLTGVDEVDIVVSDIDGGTGLWWIEPGEGTDQDDGPVGSVASASVVELAADVYR